MVAVAVVDDSAAIVKVAVVVEGSDIVNVLQFAFV